MDVKHVADLANLPLTSILEEKLKEQFHDTLKTVDVISQLDTTGVPTTVQINTNLVNVMREDVVDTSRIVSLNGFVRVKAIFGSD